MSEKNLLASEASALSSVAGKALIWGAGFTFIRDILQFVTMLVLVRIVTPGEYGIAAMAQAVIGFMSIISFNTFVSHALQIRDPDTIDWQAHFSAALIINTILFLLTILAAGLLSQIEKFSEAALPLAILSLVFLIEVPATLRHTMVQVQHDWLRFRSLTLAGAFLGSIVALIIALLGGGVWALVLPVILFGVPATIDLFFIVKWRPDFSFSWDRYKETAVFAFTRIGSAAANASRNTAEKSSLASVFDFSSLGVFTRSIGLATLAAGRVGSIILSSLYPVITRAESNSDRFKRIAGLVLSGVTWITIPIAVFLAFSSADVVSLIYGSQWLQVIELLPYATFYVALGGIFSAVYSLLLANEKTRTCLGIDIFSAILGLGLIFWLIPIGIITYLSGLVAFTTLLLVIAIFMLYRSGGIGLRAIVTAFLPPLLSTLISSVILFIFRKEMPHIDLLIARLVIEGFIYFLIFIAVIRIGFSKSLNDLLDVAPGGQRLAKWVFL